MRILTACLLLGLSSVTPLHGQAPPVPASPHFESQQDLTAKLTAQQKQQFEDAGKAFSGKHNSEALALYKSLLSGLPGDLLLSKFAAESALNTNDTGFALNTIKPVAQANPDDWQAAALLTRACAETGDKACRDSGIAHMLELHKRGITPPRLQQYVVEQVHADGHSLLIYTSLEPWGHYHVYNYAQIFNEAGQLFLRVTLESDDFDQPAFAKEHPAEAAAGLRAFSLDGYRDTGLNSNGQHTETHYTFKLLDRQPPYDTVRDAFLDIAKGDTKPVSSRTNIPSQ